MSIRTMKQWTDSFGSFISAEELQVIFEFSEAGGR